MYMRGLLVVVIALLLCLAGTACWPQALQGLPDSLLKETLDVNQLPKGTYTPIKEWTAESAPHNSGHVADDPDTPSGKAWELKPGTDDPGTPVFGPYLELPPGNYVAFFRMKLLEAAEDEAVAQLDACVSFGQDVRGARELSGADLAGGKYVQVPIGFVDPGGKLECRVNWPGTATLHIDTISVFRLEGADVSQGGWRVAEAVPSGLPKDLPYYTEPKSFPDIFPKSATPAKELLVCDLRKARIDQRLMMYCLQGLVNRAQPRIYCLSGETDPFWLTQMTERGWITGSRTVQPEELLAQFKDAYKGIIITDPNLPASKNVATMLAGVKDGLVVSPRLAKSLSLPVLDDLRGKWKTSVEAYKWAFDNLWPKLNHHVTACSWPDHLALRDYLVQNKVFIFWLSGALDGARKYASPNDEVRLMEQLFAKMPVNTPVMSYPWAGKDNGIGEGPGVSLFAEFGHYLVGSIDCANLSVHSGLPVPPLKQKTVPPAPPLQNDKVYLSFILSDGDNLPVLTSGNFPQLWQDKLRGQFPIGWTLSPAASVLIPDVVDYYYRTATPNDYFVGAVSGVGYTYPDLYGKRYRDRQKVFDGFLDQTAQYMKRSDEKDLWVMNATRPEILSRFAEKIGFLDALFPDYGRTVSQPDDVTYPTARNVPVFRAVTGWVENATHEQRVASLAADVRRMAPPQRPAFVHFFILNWFSDLPLLQDVLKELGPQYVAVRPDYLAQLWREDMAKQQVVVRMASSAAGIEGQPMVLSGSARNVSPQKQLVDAKVVEGLEGATITPSQATIEPGQEAAFIVKGQPTADKIVLELTGGFGTRRREIAVHRIPLAEVLGTLPQGANLVPSVYLEAESLAHRSGVQVADPQASGGNVWMAKKGETEKGYIVFGPYSPLEAGNYLALFRVKRTDEGAGLLATVDTCVGGGVQQTGARDVQAEDLPQGEWRWVPVAFTHPGGAFETRVIWSGAASMAVDAIAVWKVEGR
jgi:hypothetical protein